MSTVRRPALNPVGKFCPPCGETGSMRGERDPEWREQQRDDLVLRRGVAEPAWLKRLPRDWHRDMDRFDKQTEQMISRRAEGWSR